MFFLFVVSIFADSLSTLCTVLSAQLHFVLHPPRTVYHSHAFLPSDRSDRLLSSSIFIYFCHKLINLKPFVPFGGCISAQPLPRARCRICRTLLRTGTRLRRNPGGPYGARKGVRDAPTQATNVRGRARARSLAACAIEICDCRPRGQRGSSTGIIVQV